jgi:hypothetical protein
MYDIRQIMKKKGVNLDQLTSATKVETN